MSSRAPPQDPGGFKGLFKDLGTKFKRGQRAKKDKDTGSRTHQEGLSVPTTGDGYDSSTYSAGQSRSTSPVPKGINPPAMPGSATSALGPVAQTAPHRSSIKSWFRSTPNDNARSAAGTSVPASVESSNPTARLWFGAAAGFGKTFLKKFPEFVDSNPVKIVAAIVKVAIEAAETVGANKDNLTRLSTKLECLAQLEAAEDGIPTGAEVIYQSLKDALSNASATIYNLTSRSRAMRTIAYEQYSKEIQGVFDVIDDAVQAFQVQIARNIEAKAEKILDMARDEKLYRLNPSPGAHYDSDVEGQRIRREECTKGTRIGILHSITTWARDDSPQSPLVYWLTGQAGSGKTTIATSIAAKFSGAMEGITLGADFFCSRNSPESNTTRRILPTVAYQLARKCGPYAEALIVPGKLDKLDSVYSPVSKQIQSLFLIPWVQCEAHRSQSKYLIVIDALDELKENGSADFLDALFTLLEASPVNGVKIFITSRPEDRIAKRIESFRSRTIARLQEVPLEEVSPDIHKYLETQLPTLGNDNLATLTDLAAGLFIYAATAVRCIRLDDDTSIDEQLNLFKQFLKYTRNKGTSRPDFIVDELYRQIMGAALHHYKATPHLLAARLGAIHLILSTGERASTATIAALYNNTLESNGYELTEDTVMSVVRALHAVLYVKDGLIFWYHASFPDFIFDMSRSNFTFTAPDGKTDDYKFTCNEDSQQTWLRNLCFSKLKELRFNICSIQSSSDLDQDRSYTFDTLLAYSAVNWSHHLPITGDAAASDIEEFLDLRALFWIELMNIIKRASDCVSILERAQRWVRQHINVDDADLEEEEDYQITDLPFMVGQLAEQSQLYTLDEALSEIIEFASYFRAKHELGISTPHLYISHLAVWFGGPNTIQRWKKNFANLSHITHSHKDIPVIFTADGQRLIKDERIAPEIKFVEGGITSVAFLNKGAQILSGYKNGSISIWDASTGALQAHLEVGKQQLAPRDYAPATTGFDDRVCVWVKRVPLSSASTGPANNGFWSIVVSADNTKIRSESVKGKAYVWGLVSGKWQLVSRSKSSVQGSVSPSGAYCINMTTDQQNGDPQLNLHKVTPAGLQLICSLPEDTRSVAICRRGAKLQVVYGQNGNELVSLEYPDDTNYHFDQIEQDVLQKHTSVLPYHDFFDAVTISPDQSTIVNVEGGWIWNLATGNQQRSFGGSSWRVRSVAISEDNNHILFSDHSSIRLLDIFGGTKSALLEDLGDSDRDLQNWELQADGWIVSSQTNDRLMWVPEPFRGPESYFAVPQNILLILKEGYYSVDFSKAKLGKGWAGCYTPITSAGQT